MHGEHITGLSRFFGWSPDALAKMLHARSEQAGVDYVVAWKFPASGHVHFDGDGAASLAPLCGFKGGEPPRRTSLAEPYGSLAVHEDVLARLGDDVRERIVFCDTLKEMKLTQIVLDGHRARRRYEERLVPAAEEIAGVSAELCRSAAASFSR